MYAIKEKTNSKIQGRIVTKHDKVYLQALLKRQYMCLKDMYAFHDAYPEVLDRDVVGSYDSMFRVLADVCAQFAE